MNDGRCVSGGHSRPGKEGAGMAAFYIPPFVFFVKCWGEAVFFVCSEDYPEVIYQNVNLLIPTLCGSIIRVFVRVRWKIRDSRTVSRKRNVCPLPVFSIL